MDIGVKRTQTRVIHDVKSAAALGLIPWDNCTYSELISIFDTQFGALLCWLNGQNLAQTVYACHHIHAIDDIPDKKLRSLSQGVLKLAGIINDLIKVIQNGHYKNSLNCSFRPQMCTTMRNSSQIWATDSVLERRRISPQLSSL